MRILVTGAAGFVGSHVCQKLIVEQKVSDLAIGALVHQLPTTQLNGLDYLVADVTDIDAVNSAIRGFRPDRILHLAAVASPRLATGMDAWKVNLNGTLNIASAALRYAPSSHLYYVSTGMVYGRTFAQRFPAREEDPINAVDDYSATKVASEVVLQHCHAQGLSLAILRPFNHSGPGQSSLYALPRFAQSIARIEAGLDEPILRVSGLESKRDFLHISDIVDAYWRALTIPQPPRGQIWNVCSGKAVRMREIVDLFRSEARVSIAVEENQSIPDQFPYMVGNSGRIESELSWQPQLGLDVLVRDVLEHERRKLISCGE
ncbi:NAD-dependent epimerase/dehydratase family protein [Rhizobium sp. NXC24]|uniref:NAD-dependent epimerase/dehydratase family protein n=1 Tax=Rhizobium sp. NXC24 TaxID=2048897 RepID=UPI000CDF400C|nr:NAD-dependent epimerase/dehydratase family protein [Rhizobium sp. NXC24]AVA25739.1 NAD-dependent epimerase/dehydratase family protein [Rhizobium sp. NXC24]